MSEWSKVSVLKIDVDFSTVGSNPTPSLKLFMNYVILEHIEELKAAVPPERLLIFTVDQGWEPLCKFLGKENPDSEFPNVNDREEAKKTIADITKGAYTFLAIGGVLLVGIVYGLIKLFG